MIRTVLARRTLRRWPAHSRLIPSFDQTLVSSSSPSPLLSRFRRSTYTTYAEPEKRWPSRLWWYSFNLASVGLCMYAGFQFAIWVDEPPEPGSEDDYDELAMIEAEFEQLPGVQRLLGNLDYEECTFGYPEKSLRGVLNGSRGFAHHRAFWFQRSSVFQHIVLFGRGLCGFPNTIHGGAIATIADDILRVSVQAPLFHQYPKLNIEIELVNLQIDYLAPIKPDYFYSVLSGLDGDKEMLQDDQNFYAVCEVVRTEGGKPSALVKAHYRVSEQSLREIEEAKAEARREDVPTGSPNTVDVP